MRARVTFLVTVECAAGSVADVERQALIVLDEIIQSGCLNAVRTHDEAQRLGHGTRLSVEQKPVKIEELQ